MQDTAVEDRDRRPGKARARRPKTILFTDLEMEAGEALEWSYNPLVRRGGGRWEHYPERAAAPSPEELVLQKERHASLHLALDRLAPEDRELITHRYGIEGPPQTLAELARIRGCSPEAIRVRIEKIKKRLRRRLLRLKTVD